MQRSVFLIFCGRWNTSQLFVLLQEGNSGGMEQQQHEKAREPALVLGERGRISCLVPEPIQRMENRCYMAELRCLVSAFVVQSSTYIIYLILCGLDYQISFMLPFGCLEYHIYYLSGG